MGASRRFSWYTGGREGAQALHRERGTVEFAPHRPSCGWAVPGRQAPHTTSPSELGVAGSFCSYCETFISKSYSRFFKVWIRQNKCRCDKT